MIGSLEKIHHKDSWIKKPQFLRLFDFFVMRTDAKAQRSMTKKIPCCLDKPLDNSARM